MNLLRREMVLPHHLFDSPGPGRETKNGRDLFLQFKGQLILSPCAHQMEFISHGPEELKASIENSGLVGKEDGVPAVGLVFCPDDPPTDLEVSESSSPFFNIRFEDIGRILVFLMTEGKVLHQDICKVSNLLVEDFSRK